MIGGVLPPSGRVRSACDVRVSMMSVSTRGASNWRMTPNRCDPHCTDLLRLSSAGCAPGRSILRRAEPAETHIRVDCPNDPLLMALACKCVTTRRSDRSCGVFVQRNSAPI